MSALDEPDFLAKLFRSSASDLVAQTEILILRTSESFSPTPLRDLNPFLPKFVVQ